MSLLRLQARGLVPRPAGEGTKLKAGRQDELKTPKGPPSLRRRGRFKSQGGDHGASGPEGENESHSDIQSVGDAPG